SVDVKVAEAVKKAFQEQYPKIEVEVERTGSERVLQRINQEYGSNIHNVDAVNSSDASHFLFWKQQKWLAAHTPPDVKKFAAQYKDPEGYYATWRASLSCMGYNTNIVKEGEAPQGYKDLLDPKWKGKLTKSHPGYSGTALTGTYAQPPQPNAARVFQNFIYTPKIQQLIVDIGGQRSAHPDVKEPADRTPLAKIRTLPDDPAGMMPQVADIKKRYTAIFGN